MFAVKFAASVALKLRPAEDLRSATRSVAPGGERRGGRGEQGKGDVVLHDLLARLHADRLQLPVDLPLRLLPRADRVEVEVVQRHPPLEEAHQHQVVERLQQVHRVPFLVRVDPHDLVPQVAVLAADVRERVVLVIVRMTPRVRRRGGVPIPVLGVDVGVVHPIPLPVHHVVADLHVLEDLRHRQRGRAAEPQRPVARADQHRAGGQHQLTVQLDRGADVARVAVAELGVDLVVDRVELAAELLELLGGEAGEGVLGLVLEAPLRSRRRARRWGWRGRAAAVPATSFSRTAAGGVSIWFVAIFRSSGLGEFGSCGSLEVGSRKRPRARSRLRPRAR